MHLSNTIGSVNHGCEARVRDAFGRIDKLIDNNDGKELQSVLNLCMPLQTDSNLNVAAVMEKLFNYVADYVSVYHRHGIENFCTDMLTDEEPLTAFGKWITHVYGSECLNHTYDWVVEELSIEDWNSLGTNIGCQYNNLNNRQN